MREVVDGLEGIFSQQTRLQSEQLQTLSALAASSSESAKAFTSWIASFASTGAPTSSTVTEEDEYRAEQRKNAEALGLHPDQLDDLPDEFKLALALRQGFEADVQQSNGA